VAGFDGTAEAVPFQSGMISKLFMIRIDQLWQHPSAPLSAGSGAVPFQSALGAG